MSPSLYMLCPLIYKLSPSADMLRPRAYKLNPSVYKLIPSPFMLGHSPHTLGLCAYMLCPCAYKCAYDTGRACQQPFYIRFNSPVVRNTHSKLPMKRSLALRKSKQTNTWYCDKTLCVSSSGFKFRRCSEISHWLPSATYESRCTIQMNSLLFSISVAVRILRGIVLVIASTSTSTSKMTMMMTVDD